MSEVGFEKVHEDVRGRIYRLQLEGREYMLLTTKKGFRRGGEMHSTEQRLTVLKGKILLVTPKLALRLAEGQTFTIGCRIPHYLEVLEDSMVLEWKDSGLEDKEYYLPYRKFVEESLK